MERLQLAVLEADPERFRADWIRTLRCNATQSCRGHGTFCHKGTCLSSRTRELNDDTVYSGSPDPCTPAKPVAFKRIPFHQLSTGD
ncbi:hypothetical protein MPTK1_8g00220 [Marchantia polymorpha subsp. ruderalis]|uniref:Uncharacterized protein n=1 Tax=Marchantia polymorpha TaxID=3197 RepID=A0A2R6WLL7_MARPO|nr:hypothetical protein MARPO_0077s0047 [Marchantia polymorpha]BBN18160.1 hypothetical protein Mp_8g00220 [Marchantia polymorpha subsp. ruderalis]|eukprot:PTQ34723.1 hypothetical protein MARPO_0077s0047 [Marchantia polymorpha]